MRAFRLVDLGVMGLLAAGVALAPMSGCSGSTTTAGGDGGNDGTTTDVTQRQDTGTGSPDVGVDGNRRDGASDGAEENQGSETGPADAGPDGTGSPTVDCPTAPCGTGLGCCAQLSGADAGFKCQAKCTDAIDCLKPSDCDGSAPICCATAVVDETTGSFPFCLLTSGAIKSVTTSCQTAAACPSDLMMSCMATDTLRACASQTDCTEAAYPDCCGLPVDGTTVQACVPSEYAGFLTCTM
jgi:hypothetical protein